MTKVRGEFAVGTFKAIRIDKAEKGTTVALTQFDEAELMEGDVTVARRMVDAELQGWSGRHRQGPGGAALPDDRRHRLRRHRRTILASAVEGRRQGGLQRLGHGRDPSRQLRREGPRQGRLAGAAARRHLDPRRDGDRHRRLHRDAVGAGAGEARPDAQAAAPSSSPALPVASARSRPPCCRSSAITSSPPPGGCRRPTI